MNEQQSDRIELKLDKIADTLAEHSTILALHSQLHQKNTQDLDIHIKRTNLLESKQNLHEEDTDKKLDEALLPIKFFKFFLKAIGGVIAIITLYSLIKGIK